jgi:amino acid transporter
LVQKGTVCGMQCLFGVMKNVHNMLNEEVTVSAVCKEVFLKKIIWWCTMLIITLGSIFCMNQPLNSSVESDNPMGDFLIPIIAVAISVVAMIIIVIAGITGLIYLQDKNMDLHMKDFRWSKQDYFLNKLIKPMGYLLIAGDVFCLYNSFMDDQVRSMVLNTLSIILSVMYVVWFSAIIQSGYKRSELNVVNAYKRIP